MELLNVTEDSSLCNSTPINLLSLRDRLHLEWEKKATARLQHRRQREQERRWSEQIEVRQACLDRQCGKESSVALGGSVSVELDSERGPLCQIALNLNFEDATSLISDINFPVSACSGCPPHNVLVIIEAKESGTCTLVHLVPQLLGRQARTYLLAFLLSCLNTWLTPPMLAPHTLHVCSTTGLPHYSII